MRHSRLVAITGSFVLALLSPLLWQGTAGASPAVSHYPITGANGACQYYNPTATTLTRVGTVNLDGLHASPPNFTLTGLKPETVYQLGVAAAPSTDISKGCVVHWLSVRTKATATREVTNITGTLNLSWLARGTGTRIFYTLQVLVNTTRSLHNVYVTEPFGLAISPPTSPRFVTATAGIRSATVKFVTPERHGYLPVLYYKVTAIDTTNPFRGGQIAFGLTIPTTPNTITVRGLTPGDSYTFKVTATNAQGTGPASTPSTSVVPTGGR